MKLDYIRFEPPKPFYPSFLIVRNLDTACFLNKKEKKMFSINYATLKKIKILKMLLFKFKTSTAKLKYPNEVRQF